MLIKLITIPAERAPTEEEYRLIDGWCRLLESGMFRQTTGMLTRNRVGGGLSHCCLGVYAHYCAKEKYDDYKGAYFNEEEKHEVEYPIPLIYGDGYGNENGADVCIVYPEGCNEDSIEASPENVVGLNDRYDLTFSQIATVVRFAVLKRERRALTFKTNG